jgi:hypothetical protein
VTDFILHLLGKWLGFLNPEKSLKIQDGVTVDQYE